MKIHWKKETYYTGCGFYYPSLILYVFGEFLFTKFQKKFRCTRCDKALRKAKKDRAR